MNSAEEVKHKKNTKSENTTANNINCSKLTDIKGVGAATVKKLAELGIYKPADLLSFLPKSYIDLKLPVTILETVIGQFSVIT
ncbi:MAG TPA: hypothetical protein VJZ69_02495, partial [Clostridia bacterium]|nr:hypothetical protein [Clostridia bacterium]